MIPVLKALSDKRDNPGEARGPGSWRPVLFLALVLFAALLAIYATGEVARTVIARGLVEDAAARLPATVAPLRSELEKQRALPLILREDPSIAAALQTSDPARLAEVDAKLERLADATRAAVIYILDTSGMAVAASNSRGPDSFVGNDYRFRDYYRKALGEGSAEQYALGTVSRRPGVYFSARIEGEAGRPLGVVVVKVELDAVEAAWREGGQTVFVSDRRGIVVATSLPRWRFLALRPVPPDEAALIRESLQYGAAPLSLLEIRPDNALPGLDLIDTGEGLQRFAKADAPVPGGLSGWRLHLLVPADRDLVAGSSLARLVTGLTLALLVGSGAYMVRRGRLARSRRREKERAAAELERRVAERTADLANANQQLTREIATREEAEARVAALRDDLAQANRLATLGQVTAGVAHEINQPLAAIRTYTENARLFLERGESGRTGENLSTVLGLTDRIATITETLRNFGRRSRGALEPLAVEEIVEGALLILKSRIRESGVALERRSRGGPAMILGGRIRLEQVLVNLLRNALEALEGHSGGRITVTVSRLGGTVEIEVADNGPGIAPEIMAHLFTPFRTSKAKGTGLGLVISSDIVTELGGALSAKSDETGASFTIRLPEAPEAP